MTRSSLKMRTSGSSKPHKEFQQQMEWKKQEKELDFEKKLIEAKLQFQTVIQLAKEQAQEAQIQSKTMDGGSAPGHEQPAKRPKLQIACFNGTYEDWPRFWNQFVEIIDKASMPGVTKFAYLKSFLDVKVKKPMAGLPFLRLFCRMRNRSLVSEREFTRLVDWSILPWVINFCLYFC